MDFRGVLDSVTRFAFGPPQLGRESALRRVETLGALTYVLAGTEELLAPKDGTLRELTNWSSSLDGRLTLQQRMVRFCSNPKVERVIIAGQVVAGLALVLPSGKRTRLVANSTLVVSDILFRHRSMRGGDGSDQTRTVCAYTGMVGRLGGNNTKVVDAALWSAGLQCAASYFVAGFAKALGPMWREGTALRHILRSRSYGDESAWKLATEHPELAKWMSHAVVLFELGVPVIFFSRGRFTKLYALGAFTLHLGIGWSMGLGRFITAWSGMLNALMYVAQPSRKIKGAKRDDMAAGFAVGFSVLALTFFLIDSVVARRQNRSISAGEAVFYASDGSRLVYNRHNQLNEDHPIILLEAPQDLPSPVALDSFVKQLGQLGEVVTYYRAGREPSRLGEGSSLSLGDTATRAVELLDHLGRGRKKVLVSFGDGFLVALATALAMEENPELLVLIDMRKFTLSAVADQVKKYEHAKRWSRWFSPFNKVDIKKYLVGDAEYFDLDDYRKLRRFRSAVRDPMTWKFAKAQFVSMLAEVEDIGSRYSEIECPVVAMTTRTFRDLENNGQEDYLRKIGRQISDFRVAEFDSVKPRHDGLSVLDTQAFRVGVIDAIEQLMRESSVSAGDDPNKTNMYCSKVAFNAAQKRAKGENK